MISPLDHMVCIPYCIVNCESNIHLLNWYVSFATSFFFCFNLMTRPQRDKECSREEELSLHTRERVCCSKGD